MAASMALNQIAASSGISAMSSKTAARNFVGLRAQASSSKDVSFPAAKCGAKLSMAIATDVSRFENVSMAPPDPILGVTEAFKADTDAAKLNLGVGAYRTEELQPCVLKVVSKGEKLMLEKGENKEGLAAFNKATAELLLGADNPVIKNGQIATVQGLSGTGVPWSEYRYFDPQTVGLDFKGMIEDIKAASKGSVILLHGCAHNPTGIDPTPEQWDVIADVLEEKGHMPFFDVAFAQSYSKNLGLYAERIGAINVILPTADLATRVKSQLKRLARPMYSNPPVHGARIVANVVGDSVLFDEWRSEMEMMAGRIKGVRQKLYEALSSKDKSGKDWSFVLKQIGMFSFTGLNKAQSDNMSDKWHVYMTKDGRISLAGLNLAKCEYLADAIIDSYYNVK